MIEYDAFSGKYIVIGKTIAQKRAKRDGRNPATGAFSAGSHTGAVDLTVDIPMVRGANNVNLPDSTNYRKEDNNPDNVGISFKDKVTVAFSLDVNTPSNSTANCTDEYENVVPLVYVEKFGNVFNFSLNGKTISGIVGFEQFVNFVHDSKAYFKGYARRRVNGNLLLSGQEEDVYIWFHDVNFGEIFPVYHV